MFKYSKIYFITFIFSLIFSSNYDTLVLLEIENSKVSIRSIRQKANDEMKLLSKSGLSEDLLRDAENSVQKLTDSFVVKIDEIFKSKESDIMKV